MSGTIYGCTKENNTCIKKESCERYTYDKDDVVRVTLFKNACTEDNNWELYMKLPSTESEDNKNAL